MTDPCHLLISHTLSSSTYITSLIFQSPPSSPLPVTINSFSFTHLPHLILHLLPWSPFPGISLTCSYAHLLPPLPFLSHTFPSCHLRSLLILSQLISCHIISLTSSSHSSPAPYLPLISQPSPSRSHLPHFIFNSSQPPPTFVSQASSSTCHPGLVLLPPSQPPPLLEDASGDLCRQRR